MSESKHTKERYSVRQDSPHAYSILDNEYSICVAQCGSELWANRIVAAPETKAQRDELLEALKIAAQYTRVLKKVFSNTGNWADGDQKDLESIESTIDKAEGK